MSRRFLKPCSRMRALTGSIGMKRSFSWAFAALLTLTVGLVVMQLGEYLLAFRPEVLSASTTLLAAGALCLIFFPRKMFDGLYGQTAGSGVKPKGVHQRAHRDIGHLPGRAHQTFTRALANGTAATLGSLQILRRAWSPRHLMV